MSEGAVPEATAMITVAQPALRNNSWRVRFGRVLLLIATSIACCAACGQTPVRIALVIGNTHYKPNPSLPNALSDAQKLAEQLRRQGFTLQPNSYDLDRPTLTNVIAAFGKRLRAAGDNAVGFFYYAGHAAQDEFGNNYLLPLTSKARTPAQVRNEGTPLQPLLKDMEEAGNPINIVVLDACRQWYPSNTPRDPKGLHDMGRRGSTLIAYATRAGDIADEGASLESSPFSGRLIEAIARHPNDPIVLLFDDVKTLVSNDTGGEQLPLVVNGLTASGRWSFASGEFNGVPDKPEPVGTPDKVTPFLEGLDRAKLVHFFRGREYFADALLKHRDVLAKYEINTPIRLAYFLGAIGYETGGFRAKEDRLTYSAAALRKDWPRQVTSDEMARSLVGKPEAIANVIYGGRSDLGNGPPGSGDGWRYRGRNIYGLLVVGRYNYKRFGEMVGVDLLNSPDLVNDPDIGLAVSAAIWHAYNVNPAADAGDLEQIARRLRTPFNPKDTGERNWWVSRAKTAVN
ncbi:hypothetical protein DIE17_12675 [Burkholderia sp. Bp9099]|nr:hypothetical protein DIE17_12675 [Burkholderia sp. Bp9099]